MCVSKPALRNANISYIQALTYCNARKDLYGEILSSTCHILFLDKPHGNLNTQNWKAIYGQVTSRNAEEQLNIWSTALDQLARGFTEIGNHVHLDNTSHLTMCKFDNRDDPDYV